MSEKILGPGEILFQENDRDTNLYFNLGGELELFVLNSSKQRIQIELIESQQFFGQNQFFLDQSCNYGIVSSNIS